MTTRPRTDSATSPLHPIVDQPTNKSMVFQDIPIEKIDIGKIEPQIPTDLGKYYELSKHSFILPVSEIIVLCKLST